MSDGDPITNRQPINLYQDSNSNNNNSRNRRNIYKHSTLNHQQPQHRQPWQQPQQKYRQNPPLAGYCHRNMATYHAQKNLQFNHMLPIRRLIRHPTSPVSNIISSFRFNSASRDTDLTRSHAQRLEWSPAKLHTREMHLPQPQDHRLS